MTANHTHSHARNTRTPALPRAAPKKPSGAYIFFCSAKRPEVKKTHPTASMAEMTKELGALWKTVTDAEKKACV